MANNMVGGNKPLMLMFMTNIIFFLLVIVSTTHARHSRKGFELRNFKKVTREGTKDNKPQSFSTQNIPDEEQLQRPFYYQTEKVNPHGLSSEKSSFNPYQNTPAPPVPKTVAEQYSFDAAAAAETTTRDNNVDAYQQEEDDEKKRTTQPQSQYNTNPYYKPTDENNNNNNPFNYQKSFKEQSQQNQNENINPEAEEEDEQDDEDLEEEEVLPEADNDGDVFFSTNSDSKYDQLYKNSPSSKPLEDQLNAYFYGKQGKNPAAQAQREAYNRYLNNKKADEELENLLDSEDDNSDSPQAYQFVSPPPPTKPAEKKKFNNNAELTAYLNAAAAKQQQEHWAEQQNKNEIKPEDEEDIDAFFGSSKSQTQTTSNRKFNEYQQFLNSQYVHNQPPPVHNHPPPPPPPAPPAPTNYYFRDDASLNAYLNKANQEKTTAAAQIEEEDGLMSDDDDTLDVNNDDESKTPKQGMSDNTNSAYDFNTRENKYTNQDQLFGQQSEQQQVPGNAFFGGVSYTHQGQYEQVPNHQTSNNKQSTTEKNAYDNYANMFRTDP